MTRVLVWSERPELAQQLLAAARPLADASGGAVTVGVEGEIAEGDLEAWANSGADVVCPLLGDLATPGSVVTSLCELIRREAIALVLVGATKTGFEVAPRLAERLDAAYAAFAVSLDGHDGSVSATCQLYAGAGLVTYAFSRPLAVVTVSPAVFASVELPGRTALLGAPVRSSGNDPLRVLDDHRKAEGNGGLHEARAVVDVGRGVEDTEGLQNARRLAAALGAELGCSRPVASERDWLPEWLGLSGAKVKPDLCLTIGVSGAVQHVIGIRDSQVIVAVNNDENAAIFAQADIGVLADAAEFVPALIERLQARGARPAWLSRQTMGAPE